MAKNVGVIEEPRRPLADSQQNRRDRSPTTTRNQTQLGAWRLIFPRASKCKPSRANTLTSPSGCQLIHSCCFWLIGLW